MSTDELTCAQALERAALGLPMTPGHVERREFEYVRHGTRTFIVNFDVACGRVIAPTGGPTRTEADFVAHIRHTVATDPEVPRWHLTTVNLNTHCSESLVRYVAEVPGVIDDLVVKGRHGMLRTQAGRAAFLADPTHRIVFITPHPETHLVAQ